MSALPEIPKELLAPRRAPSAPKARRQEPGWELFLVVRAIQVLIIAVLWLLMR